MPELNQNGERKANINKTRNGNWITGQFSASVLLFWIKGSISIDYRGIHIVEPNTVMGIIPAGQQKQTIPLNNVSAAEISTSYKMSRFLLGILLVIVGLGILSSSFVMGLLLTLIGVIEFLNGILTHLTIEKSGTAYQISVPFFNKQDISDVQQTIEQALNTNIDKTDQSLYNHRLKVDDMDNVE